VSTKHQLDQSKNDQKTVSSTYLYVCLFVCLFVWWCFTQYFSYIVAVTFIGGGNRRTRRKPL